MIFADIAAYHEIIGVSVGKTGPERYGYSL